MVVYKKYIACLIVTGTGGGSYEDTYKKHTDYKHG